MHPITKIASCSIWEAEQAKKPFFFYSGKSQYGKSLQFGKVQKEMPYGMEKCLPFTFASFDKI